MEAIYLLTPVLNSVRSLINDFNDVPMYKCAHVYFTEGETSWPSAIIFNLRFFGGSWNIKCGNFFKFRTKDVVIDILCLFIVCGESLFDELKQSPAAKKIKTLMEISLSFLPTERQVSLPGLFSTRTLFRSSSLGKPINVCEVLWF